MKRYLTAEEVTQLLNITRPTLYAYVSRGLIRSEGGEGRTRLYAAEDVLALQARKEGQRDPSKAAQAVLQWGMPILDSALTLIHEHRLYYRGEDALGVAAERSFEEVAALLWTGDMAGANSIFEAVPPQLPPLPPNLSLMQALQLSLTFASSTDLAAYDLRPEAIPSTGARILRLMTSVITSPLTPLHTWRGGRIADSLAAGWCPDDPHAPDLLNAALILCADHELNVSAFTARVIASAEATPYAVVLGGLQALSGFKHGGNTQRVEALLREIGTPDQAYQVIAERLRRGEYIPGFGHRLYPDGDPRYRLLMDWLTESYPSAPDVHLAQAVLYAMHQIKPITPNIDFALVTLRRTLRLPPEGALVLFALGRTAGWLGHAIEQYASGQMIRPRARYIGESPHK